MQIDEIRPIIKAFALCLMLTSLSYAHEYWLEKDNSAYVLVFGHNKKNAAFNIFSVQNVSLWSKECQEKTIKSQSTGDQKLFEIDASSMALSQITAQIEDGYWSKTIYGWKHLSKSQASRVVEAVQSSAYTKRIMGWQPCVFKSSQENSLEITPIEPPKNGKLLLQISYLGKALPGQILLGGNHEQLGQTSKDGTFEITLSSQDTYVSTSYKLPLKNNPEADFKVMTATLIIEGDLP